MKKLSLILALMLVLSCAILAACGGDEESSAADSSAASSEAVSSEAASSEASSEADESDASSDAASSDAESGDVSDDSSAPAVDAGTDNLALGATYTASEQFKQGGADVQWGWDDNAPYAYPDEEGKTLTDGAKPADSADYLAAEWAGWTGVHPNYANDGYIWITLDLGETKDIAKFDIWYGTQVLGNGIGAPQSIEALVSDDGETWSSVGSGTPANSDSVLNECVSIEGAASGRYVQIRVVSANWVFLSEIEIYAPAE
ncbi:MAG: discoidin domain-containing protein [Clostridia bacterium]|nr:discoidin domain-containing protein [Clostridia bacterium]